MATKSKTSEKIARGEFNIMSKIFDRATGEIIVTIADDYGHIGVMRIKDGVVVEDQEVDW